MTEATASTPKPRRGLPRWGWLLMIASLAVNLFVLGTVLRAIGPARFSQASGGAGGLAGNLLAYAKDLPGHRRDAIRGALSADRPFASLRPLRQEIRAARREAGQLFRADPFDRAAFLAAEARVQAAEAQLRKAMAEQAADIASRMTPAERSGFLKWRELRHHGGRPGNHAEREDEAVKSKP